MGKSEYPGKTQRAMSYSTSLRLLKETHPTITKYLARAHRNREERLNQYSSEVRLAGLEELLDHLEAFEPVYLKTTKLRGVAFLIGRTHADFCTAIEASLSGYFGVVGDAMR